MNEKILKFYSRKDIQEEILKLAKNREIAVKFSDKGFGKRPDILQYPNDIYELARDGATSFHVSEERWKDPLLLKSGMSKKQLDEIREGWDLVLDIDTNYLEYAKFAAELLVEALKFNNINSIGVKFSGRSGFHIFVPFESFPKTVNNQETKLLFPDGVRNIAIYLKDLIEEPLRKKILSISSIEEIKKSTGKPLKDLQENEKFNPFSVVDIDSVLISSRHMFRAVYSINEKSGLVSIPLDPNNIKDFKLSQAKIENVTTEIPFIPELKEQEASQLIIEAFDKATKIDHPYIAPQQETKKFKDYEIPKFKVKEEFFPPCIQYILKGMPSDGRKRAVFILNNFLRHMGYSYEEIQNTLLEWNKKNYEPLRDGYIISQVTWHKKQKEIILPPNCDNESYYRALAMCKAHNFCPKIKNPVQYVKLRLKLLKQEKKPKRRKSSKKK